MDRDNRYYGLIENLIRGHKKFNNDYVQILDDIIEDVYMHSAVVIESVSNEAVIRSYLDRIVSTSIITVPKRMGFVSHTKHIGEVSRFSNISGLDSSVSINSKLNDASDANNQETLQRTNVEQDKSTKADTKLVDKMINTMNSDFVETLSTEQENVEENIIQPELLSDTDVLQNHFETLSSQNESVSIIEDEQENSMNEFLAEEFESTENTSLFPEQENVEENEIAEFKENIELSNTLQPEDIDFEDKLNIYTDETTKDLVSENSDDGIVDTLMIEDDSIQNEQDDLLSEEQGLEVNNDKIEDLSEDIIPNDDIDTTNVDNDEFKDLSEDVTSIEDVDVPRVNNDEIEDLSEDITPLEEIEAQNDLSDVQDTEILLESDSKYETNLLDETETLVDNNLMTDDLMEQKATSEDILIYNEDLTDNISQESESNSLMEDELMSNELIMEEDSNDLAYEELNLETSNEDIPILDLDTQTEENNISTTNKLNFENDINTLQFDADVSDNKIEEFESDVDNAILLEPVDNPETSLQETDSDLLKENETLYNEQEVSQPIKTDYSVFDYVPSEATENVDTNSINNKLDNLNEQRPDLNIKSIFELKYKENLTVEEIAYKLNLEKQDVVKALDEIIDVV